MQVLSKYSKSRNITNTEDVTQEEYLKALSNTQGDRVAPPDDYYNPYSFDEWFSRNYGIIAGQEHQQYEQYLKSWNASRYTAADVQKNIKADYISLLKQITLVLDKEDEGNALNNINWDDILEVERVIPFYVTKLKEILLYLVGKRDAIKKSKIKYNMTGANQALERLFYEHLLKAFTKRDHVVNVTDETVFSTFPDLSAIKDGFQIQIQELYDNQEYFDKDPSLSGADYFDTSNPDVTGFYESMNIESSAYEWLFKTGFTQLCADNPLLWMLDEVVQSELPLSAFQSTDSELLNDYLKFQLSEKYIGTNQYFASNGYFVPWEESIDYDIVAGNNWFFWPSGEHVTEQPDFQIDDIPLSSTNLIDSGATGYKNYLGADKIFVQHNNTVSGAWLRKVVTNNTTDTMSAKMFESEVNRFKFPFPGLGTIGEDIPWGGPTLSNLDVSINFLSVEEQDEIAQNYWTDTTTTSAVCAIQINDTNLVDSGANAGQLFGEADKVHIRPKNVDSIHDLNPNQIYQDDVEHAWLYKMDMTDIPIPRGQTYVHWPLYTYKPSESTRHNILTSQCAPLALSTIPMSSFIGGRAGYNLFDSDILYKLDGRNGDPIECAFLSGLPITDLGGGTLMNNATGVIQNGLTLKCKAGEYTTFIWTDADTYIDDVNLQHVEHQSDCPYLLEDHHSLYNENPSDQDPNIDYKQWQKCECRAINYSPLGHAGSSFDEYKQMADFIVEDTLYPLPFNLNSWADESDDTYQTSSDFTWFQLAGDKVEPDIGWGNGNWVAGGNTATSNGFQFKQGRQYKYFRSGLGHAETYLTDDTVPYLIAKHRYVDTNNQIWMKATANRNGDWNITESVTDMVLDAGDYVLYDHMDSNWYCVTSTGDYGSTTIYNTTAINATNSVWQNFTVVTSGETVRLLWPDTLFSSGPSALSFELSSVVWTITTPAAVTHNYERAATEVMEIYADTVGQWAVSATGYKSIGGEITYENIGDFYTHSRVATPTVTGDIDINTIYTDTINMSINNNIYGWNYTTKAYDGTSLGARPFWAAASDQDNRTTKNKGTNIWGGGLQVVDDYVFIAQPEFADVTFNTNTYIEYETDSDFVWNEELTFITATTSQNWCELVIDESALSPLSGYLYNINEELVVSASETTSNIILKPVIDGQPVFVNYWSNSEFSWTQVFTNSSLGLPPTGGVFVPFVTGELVGAIYPYANLTNRHFPTIATVPHLGELYSREDSGGYFVPQRLGASTFLSKQNENTLGNDTLPNQANRGLSAVYQELNDFNIDSGLTKRDQASPVTTDIVDSSWMKSAITEGEKSGFVADTTRHQEFIPYQTKYETRNINDIGIVRQGDSYDPWVGDEDEVWADPTNWPPSFKGQYDIEGWYDQFPTDKTQWEWKCDIFGNEYALFKELSAGQTMYNKKQLTGDMWFRGTDNRVRPASAALSGFFFDFASISSTPLVSSEYYAIKNIDLFYDTLMVETENWVLFNKIDYDYSTGEVDFDVNNIHYINLKATGRADKFGGIWLFDDDKSVTISVLASSDDGQIFPQLQRLDLDTNKLKYIYNEVNSTTSQLSTLDITSFEEPVFTYNSDTQNYNMAFISHSSSYSSFLLGNMFFSNSGGDVAISNLNILTPSV
jgi:hypothetical protein